jgi:hypothetical protein
MRRQEAKPVSAKRARSLAAAAPVPAAEARRIDLKIPDRLAAVFRITPLELLAKARAAPKRRRRSA